MGGRIRRWGNGGMCNYLHISKGNCYLPKLMALRLKRVLTDKRAGDCATSNGVP